MDNMNRSLTDIDKVIKDLKQSKIIACRVMAMKEHISKQIEEAREKDDQSKVYSNENAIKMLNWILTGKATI